MAFLFTATFTLGVLLGIGIGISIDYSWHKQQKTKHNSTMIDYNKIVKED